MITFPKFVKKLDETSRISKSETYNCEKNSLIHNLVTQYDNHANNSKINRPHECCLKIIYSDKQPSYEAFFHSQKKP